MKLVDCLWNPVAARERMLLLLSCCDSAATTVSSFRLHPYCSPPSSGFYSGTLIVFMISFRTASASSLRRIAEDESQFQVFLTHGFDFEGPSVTLERCRNCHQGIGVISFTSYSRVQFENKHTFIMVHAGSEAEESAAAVTYLEGRESWKLLQRLMR